MKSDVFLSVTLEHGRGAAERAIDEVEEVPAMRAPSGTSLFE
ncbi:hypothetical protein [Nocardia sp. BSTN01]|nr:hypothetical protein [Nocardia sp. BSTN01]